MVWAGHVESELDRSREVGRREHLEDQVPKLAHEFPEARSLFD